MTFASISPAAGALCIMTSQLVVIQLVWGHGRVMEPPSRASLWRFPEFAHLNPPQNYDDNQLYCGNMTTQYDVNGGKCGICGDSYSDPAPRPHEDGGEYAKGIIVRGYRSGQMMPVEVELTASHNGYLQFRLCSKDDIASHLNPECYEEHLLKFSNVTTHQVGTNYQIPVRGEPYYARYSLQLPKGVTCKHCVLQWHYQTGNRWGNCSDGTAAMGCGDQEVFRACSDISIYPEDTNEKNIERNPNSKFGNYPSEANSQETKINVSDETTDLPNNSTESSSSSSWQLLQNLAIYNISPIHG